MRITGRTPFSACLRASALALILLTVTGACASTAQQRWVRTKFSECKTLTNVSDIKLDHVRPDGQWSATVQSRSDFAKIETCMQDEAVSASLYRRQVELGDTAAMANLGRMYEEGRGGLPKSDKDAVLWYRRGAQAGNGQAMASLGLMYELGRGGLMKDPDAAVQWYRKGADTGDRFAMYYMGRAHEMGLGGSSDRNEAIQWYRKAAASGFPPAVERLRTLQE
jgi:TPR repeat protein